MTFVVLFAVAQGGVIFLTALVAVRRLGLDSNAARIVSMVLSWAGWIVFTLIGYFALGGEGGIMDGFGMLLILFRTASISAFIYLIAWICLPKWNDAD